MKNKLAIFDLDGTLYNTNDVNYLAYKQAMELEGYQLDYDYYCKNCNGRHYKVFLPELTKDDPALIERIHNKKKELYESNLKKAKPNQHLFHLIHQMREEYYTAVVTTASRKNCMDILDFFDETKSFDLILTQEDVSNPKPDPEGFLKAMHEFGISASDTIIFEDSKVGIEAAEKSGANVFAVVKF